MKKLSLFAILLASAPAFAIDETCYELSPDGRFWNRTPEILCVTKTNSRSNQFEITLRSGMPFSQETIASFNYNLLSAARCLDCNQNVYGIANPSNSIFNELSIRFNGKRESQRLNETGTVKIGSTQFYYQSAR